MRLGKKFNLSGGEGVHRDKDSFKWEWGQVRDTNINWRHPLLLLNGLIPEEEFKTTNKLKVKCEDLERGHGDIIIEQLNL